jgi:hypothetical protein
MTTNHAQTRRHFIAFLVGTTLIVALPVLAGDDNAITNPPAPSQTHAARENPDLRVYTVNKRVSSFPTNDDLSTPEAAYATINRLSATGDKSFWRRISVPSLAQRMPVESGTRAVTQKSVAEWLNTEIVEVRIQTGNWALVVGKAAPAVFDLRWLERVNGRWLNEGNDVKGSLAEARNQFARRLAIREVKRQLSSRPPVAGPEEHLKPFVDFLRREAADPRTFLLKTLAGHAVTVLGEVHNRPRYWAFNSALVRSPEFARETGVIYLEFPVNDQPLMDRFLAAPTNDPAPVVEMLRDLFEMGWPDQPTVEFCQAVWEVNQTLPKERRLRIVLVDMARPWREIQKREDWQKYDVNRDEFMADNILRDLRKHRRDTRHALFIVGWMHATKNLVRAGGEPIDSAGRRLQQALGSTNVLAVFPHCPVMSNQGGLNGRLALGLFETAFATLTNRPMAFPLDHGPFGELPFDASMESTTSDPYRAGFDAFLYLGPLEDEIMSPLVPGFYTDEYAREVDRRCRLMNGKGLAKVDGSSLVQLRSQWWGQPRRGWQELGPLTAWQYGSDWETKLRDLKQRNALEDAAAIKQSARRLLEAIRKADYENPGDWQSFPARDVDYTVQTDAPGWMRWICRNFRTNPIVEVELGEVFRNSKQMPALNYRLTLQNRQTLEGTLLFRWNTRTQRWDGGEGLDWHRR